MRCEIDLVVFDMDDVLVQLDRAHRLSLLSAMTGKDAAFIHGAIWGSDFEVSAEAGAYPTGAEYLAEFNRRTQSNLQREQWAQARRDASRLNANTVALAEALRGRCKIAMLTNNGALLHECLPSILPEVHRVFGEHAHASFQFGARKPEPLVFQRLLHLHATAAGRAVFIDDNEDFVRGARHVGMHGISYTGAADLAQSLRKVGMPV